jgi:hypothetical protein
MFARGVARQVVGAKDWPGCREPRQRRIGGVVANSPAAADTRKSGEPAAHTDARGAREASARFVVLTFIGQREASRLPG